MALKFVHAADLHLDSSFIGLGSVDSDIARLLKNATFHAFNNIINLCTEQQVDFLLIAGDVYDGASRSLKAQLAFRDGLRKLAQAGIESYIVHGNHDPLDGWASSLEWPKESHFFRAQSLESVVFERDGEPCADISGVSFQRRDVYNNLVPLFKPSSLSLFHIGLLHCNVGTNTGHEPYAPCTLNDLLKCSIDYWALGHVHTKTILADSFPAVVYPGNPQGRHINELGPRGCFLVEVSETKEVDLEFVPVDAVRWGRESISIEGLASEEELLTAMENSVLGLQESAGGRPCVCRITLTGRGLLHATLHRPSYAKDLLQQLQEYGRGLEPLVWVDNLDVITRPSVDLEVRRQAQDILGDCLRLVAEYREDSGRLYELRHHLKALYEDRQLQRLLSMPDDVELLALLAEAENVCLERLYEEED